MPKHSGRDRWRNQPPKFAARFDNVLMYRLIREHSARLGMTPPKLIERIVVDFFEEQGLITHVEPASEAALRRIRRR